MNLSEAKAIVASKKCDVDEPWYEAKGFIAGYEAATASYPERNTVLHELQALRAENERLKLDLELRGEGYDPAKTGEVGKQLAEGFAARHDLEEWKKLFKKKAGLSRHLHSKIADIREFISDATGVLCNASQLVQGWHTDVAWTAWDQEVSDSISALLKRAYALRDGPRV